MPLRKFRKRRQSATINAKPIMDILKGKKTYIGIILGVISLLVTWFAPGEVSKAELEELLAQGQQVYELGRRDLWPLVSGLVASLIAIYGRAVAKP